MKLHCIPKAYQSLLQKPMAKNYKQFQRTDQNTPQTEHRKILMSSKKINNLAFLANFSPYRHKVNERSHFPTKNFKINPFVVKSFLESNCNRSGKSAIPENFNQKLETQLKKTHSNNGGNSTYQKKKVNGSCYQFPSFMSEPYLRTRSMT